MSVVDESAYPSPYTDARSWMALRDYFAAQMIPAIYARWSRLNPDQSYESMAEAAYCMADAMMRERKS